MKLWNKCICVSKYNTLIILVILVSSSILIASAYITTEPLVDQIPLVEEKEVEAWIPTAEDIAYQDSMYSIIQNTQKDVDTIKADIDRILYKLERLEYSDGTYDSIRYVEGSKIDKKRNQ